MKKFLPILMLAFVGLFIFSCDNNDDDVQITDSDTISSVYDFTQSFSYNNSTGYTISKTWQNELYSSDVILVYRKSGTSGGKTIWQQIPRTLYFNEGELDYDFDFTSKDVEIKAGGSIDIANQSPNFKADFIDNQTFRVVIVPANYGNKNSVQVDFNDYNAVIKHYKIDDTKVKNL